jgi:hypothetical protein
MMSREVVTLSFLDAETSDEGTIVVRHSDSAVGLTLSLRGNGDVEAFLSPRDCERVIDALREGVKRIVDREL